MSLLAAGLVRLGESEEADSLLLDAWSMLVHSAETTEQGAQETIRRRVELYEAWDKSELASDLRARQHKSRIKCDCRNGGQAPTERKFAHTTEVQVHSCTVITVYFLRVSALRAARASVIDMCHPRLLVLGVNPTTV